MFQCRKGSRFGGVLCRCWRRLCFECELAACYVSAISVWEVFCRCWCGTHYLPRGREALLEQLVAKEIDDNDAYLLFFKFSEAARDEKALVLPALSRCCAPFKEAQIRSTTLVKYAFAS